MNLKDTLLLEGKKYENYYKEKKDGKRADFFKKYLKNEHQLRRYIMASDPTANHESTGNYTDWIIRELDKEEKRLKPGADWMYWKANDIKKTLEFFDKNKKSFKFQDINKYSINDLYKEMTKVSDDKATNKMKGYPATFEQGEWKVIEIKNHQMACNLGSGSKWCVTMKDYPEQYYKYKKFGPIFFVIKGNRRWAVTGGVSKHDTVYNVWNENDTVIESKKWKENENVPKEIHMYLIRRYMKEAPKWGDGE